MSAFEISSSFIDQLAVLEPTDATLLGVHGHDHEWGDQSPDGVEALASLWSSTRAEVAPHISDPDPWQRHAARVLTAWLDSKIVGYEAGDTYRSVNHTYSTFQVLRDTFDQMDRSTKEAWENICSRLEGFTDVLRDYRATLEVGRQRELVQSARQIESVAQQARALASETSAFSVLPGQMAQAGFDLSDRLASAIVAARGGAGEFAAYLESDYMPSAEPDDGVGAERYFRGVDYFLGTKLDPAETYAWGWEEVARLRSAMAEVAKDIVPDGSVAAAIDLLENDPARAVDGTAAFAEFVRERQRMAVADLDGAHFDVPEAGKTITINIAPASVPPGAWYIPATEDNSRPGGVWYAFADRHVLPLYQEVSTAYHEGFPGHHLQFAVVADLRQHLSRAHRTIIWYAGYGEGWALYAERLMHELGYFEKPDYVMGFLVSQLFRACRVVVDIGCHLGYRIPEGASVGAGEVWSYERAVEMMHDIARAPAELATSEVKRYLGWPAQAISYKVGERAILGLREDERRRLGSAFDLKEFHAKVLGHGEVRLDMLTEVVGAG
jgi:uncharacterized protein (DUF885 family)